MWYMTNVIGIVASTATSFLFLLRVRAVYEKSKPITLLFGVFWLAIPTASTLVSISYETTVSSFILIHRVRSHF